jgi:hypothetical protein
MRKHISVFMAVLTVLLVFASISLAQKYKGPEDQKRQEEMYDKLKIARSAEMRTDTSESFITIPDAYPEVIDFDVAKTPPAIDFAIVQELDPWYLPSFEYKTGGIYGGWGDVTRGPDDCYYFSIGNHMSYGGTAYIIKYDPVKKEQSIVVDLKKVAGYGNDVFGDGKFHGDPDIGPGGDMWLLSFFGPGPDEKDLATVYNGSWLIRYNIFSGEVENLGIPLEGESWPYHSYDWQRGLLFGVGAIKNYVIAYDTKARRMIYGGAPPQNIHWNQRGIMLDRETGKIYTTDSYRRKDGTHKFVCYERRNNKFTIMNSQPPTHTVTGQHSQLRAHTEYKDVDGAFWCFDMKGVFFKFYPDEDKVELVGLNWGKEGQYVSNMSFSPKKRYIYYVINAATSGGRFGTPVVQYDTKTDRKKVIAFIHEFYLEKYGYGAGGTYGIELDEKGESIFFYTNGRFTTKGLSSTYGRNAIFHVHIPESERIE